MIYQGIPEQVAPYMILGEVSSIGSLTSSSTSSTSGQTTAFQGILGEDISAFQFVGFKINNSDNRLYKANKTDCPAIGIVLQDSFMNNTVFVHNNLQIVISGIDANQNLFLNNDGGVESFIWEVGKYLQVLGMSLTNDIFIVDVQTPYLMS